MQTRWQSFRESATQVLIGYLVSLASQLLVFPLFGIYVPFTDNLLIGIWFAGIMLVKQYVIRRWFTKKETKAQHVCAVESTYGEEPSGKVLKPEWNDL